VVALETPPLRRPSGDLPLLAEHFVNQIWRAEGFPGKVP